MKQTSILRTAALSGNLAAASANYFLSSNVAVGHPLGLGAAGPQHAALQG